MDRTFVFELLSLQVPLNPSYQVKEVEFTILKVQCKAVVCPTSFKTQRFCEMLREICPEIGTTQGGKFKSSRLPYLEMVIVTDSRQPGMLHVDDVMQAGESRHHKELMDLQSKLSFDDPINIQFTSGTTGNPKGAVLSHHNIVNNAYFLGLRVGYGWRPRVRVCVPVPFYHCFGSVLGGMSMAVHGITLVFPSTAYNSCANLEAIQSEKCNFVYGTPTMFTDLLSQDLQKYDLSSVEAGVMGGSPCVVGVKDWRLGEQVCACIKLKEGQSSSAEEIRAFCKGQISHFKIPHYVLFVDSYPLTVSGKIKKNILKETMEKKLGL
ncbi:medium-chain acyl-CoA ligase ACSF2, mitochondrial-like [Neolamprologus brichardi]|uniref:medium-chain acyl-CoA ligase ACSF2, mitochondrial-like n=1 Tax=Neolamprologus brichardi TaxID=32507 RepID=UPI001643F2F0|nr:medium-chain acyl-CoA ligase ACSF2, mitochondrial-like [Neolamprologus brichardi]